MGEPQADRGSAEGSVPSAAGAVAARGTGRGAGAATVGDSTARGFVWLLLFSVVERGSAMVGMFILTWLLDQRDFGLVNQVYTLTALAALVQQLGVRTVLIREHKRFQELATAAFWLSLSISLVVAGVVAGLASVAAWYYNEPDLVPLVYLTALTLPMVALSTVPDSKLAADMKFAWIARVGMVVALSTILMQILLARLGAGAAAILIPPTIAAAGKAAVNWWACGVRIRLAPDLARWRVLLAPSTVLFISQLALMLVYTGHSIVVGRMATTQVVGLIGIAFQLSDAAIRSLMLNLSGVLFPALTQLNDDLERQGRAFLRAIRALMLVGMPVCVLQAILAGPVIRLLMAEKWEPAIGCFSILSLAMLGRLVLTPAEQLITAHARFGLWARVCWVYAVGYFAFLVAGTWLGGLYGPAAREALGLGPAATGDGLTAAGVGMIEGCAVAMALVWNIMAPVAMRIAVGPSGRGWREVGNCYAFPVLASLISGAAAVLVIRQLPDTELGDAASLLVAPLVMGTVYLLLVRRYARDDFYDLLGRLRRIIPRALWDRIERHALRRGRALGASDTPAPPPAPPPGPGGEGPGGTLP